MIIPLAWRIGVGVAVLVVISGLVFEFNRRGGKIQRLAEQLVMAKADHAACEASKLITEKVSNEYQGDLADLDARYRAAKRVRPQTCITVQPASTAPGRDAGAAPELLGAHGVPSEALYDYARDAEATRLQLIACQGFVRAERAVP